MQQKTGDISMQSGSDEVRYFDWLHLQQLHRVDVVSITETNRVQMSKV